MDFAEESKSLWPISSVFSAPLLLSDDSDNDSRKLGPLFFNPSPNTLTQITISPSLYSPSLSFSPFPHLSLSRFLETTTNASILPSTSYSIASSTLGPQDSHTPWAHNSLEMMKCSGLGRVLLFFPAGQNLDQVGFLLLSVEGGQIGVKFSGASSGLNHRILRLLVQKVDDCASGGSFVEENDRFVAFSGAGPDDFHYIVASNSLLFLCDVRKPLKPVLQWNHSIDNPAYIIGVKLSKLRSNSKNDDYMWASKNGYSILMGTFWNCEFSLFCYGPNTRTCAEISRLCKSFYAWKLPSELSLAACDCYCGSCLLREEFSKDALPEWIDWQQKKDIVLGFCILDEDLSIQLFEPENFGGFTVIRLMSSGNLELQRYFASHEAVNFSDKAHKESSILLKESLICETGDEEYKFSKQLYFLKLDYFYGHLSDKLGKVLMNKKKETSGNAPEVSSNPEFHQDICQKLKACGINKFRSSADISYAVRDIVSPMSMLEIAVMSMWSSWPPILLRMGFVTYVDLCNITVSRKNLSLQFLDVPDQPQLPPFTFRNPSHCSNKPSHKMQHGNVLVGPAAPLHFLVTYNKLYIEEEADGQSANRLVELECNKVMQMVNKVVVRDAAYENLADDSEHAVSLANDKDDMCNSSQDGDHFSIYKPVAFSNKISNVDPPASASSTFENQNYLTFLSRCSPTEVYSSDKLEYIKPEAIDAICCPGLKFRDRAIDHLPAEFKYFLGQQKKFKNSFTVKRSSFRKQNL